MVDITTKPNRRYPSLPEPGDDIKSHSEFLRAVKAAVQTHERRDRDILHSFVRLGELVDLGMIKVQGGQIVLEPGFAAAVSGATALAPVITLAGTAYTLADLTVGAWHEFTSASPVVITVMNEAAEPIEDYAEYGFMCAGAGGITVVSDDLADIVPPLDGTLVLETDDFAMLKRRAADSYKFLGETVAA